MIFPPTCVLLGLIGILFQRTAAEGMDSVEETVESPVQSLAILDNFGGILSCPTDPLSSDVCMMQIYDATYRELCDSRFENCDDTCKDSVDATQIIRKHCANLFQNQCIVMGGNSNYQGFCPGRQRHLIVRYSCGCVRKSPPVFEQFGGTSLGGGTNLYPAFASGVGTSLSLCQFKLFKNYIGCNN
ncbi:hypothetical protein BV898_03250 [Hypsibius exemplaris]|uniref:SUEL-type lectin domain-containing protein n=1 Tax=Hypsibius exemplaris TaxID=2072580 RepID=A0A1W0X5K4_HYPEX|nr:hypothetical protein BV898_03250 [Hypsibius exemplaris]